MFLAKTAKQTYDTIAQLAHLANGQNQNTALLSSPADLDLIGPSASKHGNPSHLHSSVSSTATETSVETASPQPQLKMSRNSTNNGKRHKNHAGHKASKHRKNNKGSKANNSHNNNNNNAHQKQRRPRINRAISSRAEWYAVAAMQGRRPHMEDTCNVLTPDPTGPTGGDLLSLFGVFDGHGGKKVAQFLKEHLLEAIVEAYGREREEDGDDPDLQRTPTERLQAILPRTFLQVDQRCMEDDRLSGSTAVVAIVTDSDIVVANVGDSRGIIYRTTADGASSSLALSSSSSSLSSSGDSRGSDSGDELSTNDFTDDEAETDGDTDTETDTDEDLTDDEESAKKDVKSTNGEKKKKKRRYRKKPEEGPVGKIGWWQALSVDHKPNRPDERERVERCGGRVTKRPNDVWRFQSVLAVSRAFGDHGLKAGPGGRGLTALPEIRVIPRQDNDLFFVLASDGLWDVYTNEQAARVGRNALLQGGSSKNTAQQVADALAHGAYNKDSLDNITALVVLLEGLAANNSNSGSSGDSSSEEDGGDGEGSNNLSAPNSPPLSARSRHSEL